MIGRRPRRRPHYWTTLEYKVRLRMAQGWDLEPPVKLVLAAGKTATPKPWVSPAEARAQLAKEA